MRSAGTPAGDLELPEDVLDDLLLLSADVVGLISMVTLASADWRDLRVSADSARGR